jgi:hypothetical protein
LIVTVAVSWTRVPLDTVLGSENPAEPEPTNGGFGIVSPFAMAHAWQSWLSDRVIVADDGVTFTTNAELSGFTLTCGGSSLLTEMVVLLAGTLHRVS